MRCGPIASSTSRSAAANDNVYVGGAWDRVEHFHEPCYAEAGKPFGDPVD